MNPCARCAPPFSPQHNIQPIDIVVVNLYPFRQTVTAANKPSYEVGGAAAAAGAAAWCCSVAQCHWTCASQVAAVAAAGCLFIPSCRHPLPAGGC